MKLYYTTNSPFARKVLMVAAERGLTGNIELIVSSPWTAEANILTRVNPAGKVPALTMDDGLTLFDSPVICEYLDSLGHGPKLFPTTNPERWLTLKRQALGDALLDAMIARRLESRRSNGERSEAWMDRQKASVNRCLDAMEADARDLGETPTIGEITYLCALAHLDFRFAEEDWRPGRTELASWYSAFSKRHSAKTTLPHD
ncbi:MAG: glutathione S-transferase N-terminal domain-containing protein [Rhizobiales bacterium]|nr:glutathione S-transferase N-terminal domain-containing protein [Hyphomicrobiales bacterium]